LKVLKGNPGGKRLAKREGELPSDCRPPAILKDEARAEWDRVAPLLQRLGLLKSIDREVLVVYCVAVADFRWAIETIRKQGRIAFARNGKRCAHPALLIQRQAAATIHRVSAEFGMTPAARAGLDITASGGLDPDDEDLFGDTDKFFKLRELRPMPLPRNRKKK
jgi:P27 family predicted phage terminase small subunit